MDNQKRSNRQNHVSNNVLTGYSAGDTGNIHPAVGLKPAHSALAFDTGKTNAYVGLDALFTPITIVNRQPSDSTQFDGHLLPQMHPTGYSAFSNDIDSSTLNLYRNSVNPATCNVSMFNTLTYSGGNAVNTMAWRLPAIGAGWGYDINNRIVPSGKSYPTSQNSLHPEDWKVGPIDLRWDELRGVWTGAQPMNVIKTVAMRHNHDFLILEPQSMTGVVIDREDILGLEYCQVCSGEVVYLSQLTAPSHQFFALTKPMKGVRVITGLEIQNDVLYLQYSYIVTPYVSAGQKLVNNNGQISLEPATSICDDLNSHPSVIGIPKVPNA